MIEKNVAWDVKHQLKYTPKFFFVLVDALTQVYLYFRQKILTYHFHKDRNHKCEGGIENFLPRSHPLASQALSVMTNGDREGRIFLSHPHKNNGFFFLHKIKYHTFIFKKGSLGCDIYHNDITLMCR